jgi:hypothetical protein
MGLTAVYIVFVLLFIPFALKKKTRWKIAVPFFSLGLLIFVHFGIFEQYSYVDSDLIFHKSLLDMMLDNKIFRYDLAMQFYDKMYPKGYHFLMLFLGKIGISVFTAAKILGLGSCLIVPFLFYFLGRKIYKDNQTAFFAGIFCVTASIWQTVYYGLPRSLAFVFFLSGLFCLFSLKKDKENVFFLVLLQVFLLSALAVHPSTFGVLWIFTLCFLGYDFYLAKKSGHNLSRPKVITFFLLISYAAVIISVKTKTGLTLSTWDFFEKNKDIFMIRVPYADRDFFRLLFEIGFIPIILFLKTVYDRFLNKVKRDNNPELDTLLFCTICLVLVFFMIAMTDKLFFLRMHRFVPFISALMYLAGVLTIKQGFEKIRDSRLLRLALCLLLFMPSINHLENKIAASGPRYDFDLVCNNREVNNGEKNSFDDVMALSRFIKNNIPKDEIIACPIEKGDLLRMYSRRAVTASWKIGGMITVYQQPLSIFKQQMLNSRMLYIDPLYLARKYNARYFLFDKNRTELVPFILEDFEIVWQNDELCFCRLKG